MPVLDIPNGTQTWLQLQTAQALTPGHSYTWYVGTHTASTNIIDWSDGVDFTVSPLAAPAAGGLEGTIATTLPTYAWSQVAGADHYKLWLSDLTTGQVVINRAVTATWVTPTAVLTLGHEYEWWVAAVSTNGQATVWNAGLTFTVAPTTSGPNGTAATTTPAFAWNTVTGADHYYLWVTDQTTGVRVINDDNVAGTSLVSQTLTLGHNYLWWVGAVEGQDISWSSGTTFTIAPTLAGPSDTVATTTPTFVWNPVTGAAHYYLWVTDQTTGQQVIDNNNVNALSSVSQALTLGHTYIWWVGAVTGTAVGWSTGATFRIAPTASAPSGAIPTALPEFTWNAVTGADHYFVWVVDQTTGELVINDNNVAGLAYRPVKALAARHQYIWWVGAVSADGMDIAWDQALSFNIV